MEPSTPRRLVNNLRLDKSLTFHVALRRALLLGKEVGEISSDPSFCPVQAEYHSLPESMGRLDLHGHFPLLHCPLVSLQNTFERLKAV